MPTASEEYRQLMGGQDQSWSGTVLPFSSDAQGNVSFDMGAGIPGMIGDAYRSLYDAVTLPGDVYTGKVDPKSDEGIARAFEMGAWFTPMTPGMRAGERALPTAGKRMQQVMPETPSADALKAASREGYNQARDMGVDFSSDAVKSLGQRMQVGLEQDGILAELAPKTHTIILKLQQAPDGSVAPLSGLEAARRAFGKAAKDFNNPTEQLAAERALKFLDDFVANPDPQSVVAGPAAAAARTIKDARGNYAAAMRSDRITGAGERAELQAAAANSGANLENAIRQRVKSILLNPKQRAGFNEEEIALLDQVVRGTDDKNVLRVVGNLLGGGGGLGSMVSGGLGAAAGGVMGGPLGAGIGATLPPAMGAGAKMLNNRATQAALQNADKITRQRSPLFQQALEGAPMEALGPGAGSQAAVRGGMGAAAARGAPASTITIEDIYGAVRRGEMTPQEGTQLIRVLQGNET